MTIEIEFQETGSGAICRAILDELPDWFGIEEAVEDYVAVAERSPSMIARDGDTAVGILTMLRHSPYAAEVYVMGVLPEHHRRGIGSLMLRRAEEHLATDGVEFLQVKTLSPSREDTGYERTRAFYLAQGFRPLEEFPDLWDPANPALQLIKALDHLLRG